MTNRKHINKLIAVTCALGSVTVALLAAGACSTFNHYGDPVEQTGDGGQGGSGTAEATCEDHECGAHASCNLIDDVPLCECHDGYELDGEDCEDIDECALETSPCDPDASCENLPGSYACTCGEGYFGDGTWCRPLTQLVSVGLNGEAANAGSFGASVSEDGRFVAFSSSASNLVEGDTNEVNDVFVRDMLEGKTVRVSVSSAGGEGNGGSSSPSISADGRYVAFLSVASNLVSGDTNDAGDVFVHDLIEKTTTRVSVGPDGIENPFSSWWPVTISANGQSVVFGTDASNAAVVGPPAQNDQIILGDLTNGVTTRTVSVDNNGHAATGQCLEPSVSRDGKLVVFVSNATNLPGAHDDGYGVPYRVILADRSQSPPALTHVSTNLTMDGGSGTQPAIAANGRFVAFESSDVEGETTEQQGIFVRDLEQNVTVRASVSTAGTKANGANEWASLSADGRKIAFQSSATNLASDDENESIDIFVRDVQEGTTIRASVGSFGAEGDADSRFPSLSGDGRFVGFQSNSTTFGHSDGTSQVYLRYLE